MLDQLAGRVHVIDWRREPNCHEVLAYGLCGQRFFRYCSHTKVWPMEDVREYLCKACGTTFESRWTEEQALAEMRRYFGDLPVSNRMYVCEACYGEYMAEYEKAMKRGAFTRVEPS